MKKSTKETSGITIIALVITIIILLILVGVSINRISGDEALLMQAKQAKEEHKKADIIERLQIEILASYDSNANISIDLLNKNLKNISNLKFNNEELSESNRISILPAVVEIDGLKLGIDTNGEVVLYIESGKTYDIETRVAINDKIITIPSGATVSGIEGEYEDLNSGLVIYMTQGKKITNWNDDVLEKYDQFVFVPLKHAILDLSDSESNDSSYFTEKINELIKEDIYPMAIKKNDNNYISILYNFSKDETTSEVKVNTYSNNYTEEPAISSAYDNNNTLLEINGIIENKYTSLEEFKKTLQEDFNKMVERVDQIGGFWIGRYETSNMSNETTTTYDESNKIKVNIVKGTTNGISNITWYRMYAQEKIYADSIETSFSSNMIWGCQWDQVMIWLKDIDNSSQNTKYILNGLRMGNYNSGVIRNTGYYKTRNIYDLGGNVSEWTMERNGGKRTDRRWIWY